MIITINGRNALSAGVTLRTDVYTTSTEYHADLTPYQVRRIKAYFRGQSLALHPMYVEMEGRRFLNVRTENNTISWR